MVCEHHELASFSERFCHLAVSRDASGCRLFLHYMGDMGKPLAPSRLGVMRSTSHTAVITQSDLLHALIEPFAERPGAEGILQGRAELNSMGRQM